MTCAEHVLAIARKSLVMNLAYRDALEEDEVGNKVQLERLRKRLMIQINFSDVDEQLYTALCPFHLELNLTEAQSCLYLMAHGTIFE